MRKIAVFLSILLSFGIHANTLRSTQAKSEICNVLVNKYARRGFDLADCKKGTFTIDESKTKSGELNNRRRVTLMEVNVEVEDKTFTVQIRKRVSVNSNGEIVLGNWFVSKFLKSDLGSTTKIMESHSHSRNVKKLKSDKGLPKSVKDWAMYDGMPDYDLVSLTYYKINDPDDAKKVIGYIKVEFTESEEAGLKVEATAKFDLKGNVISEDEESWGINE